MNTLWASQFPSQAQCNPYIQLLKQSLGEWGIHSHEHTLSLDGRGMPPPRLDQGWLMRHRGRVDVLHFHWLQKFYRAPSIEEAERKFEELADFLSLAHKLDYRIAYTFHNLVPHEGMGLEMDLRVRRLIIEHADVLTCFSQRQRERLQETFGPIPLKVIAHPNYLGYYPDDLDSAECRRRLGLPAKARVLTFLGLVRPYKDLALLIEQFNALDPPETYLLLAGAALDPALAQQIEAMANGKINIRCHLRWIEDQEVQLFMKAADVIALPYRKCWTSGAMMLAFSFAKPVVSPDPIMIDHPEGLGFFYQDEAGLGPTLLAAVRSNELAEMGSRCLEYARQHSWRRAGELLASGYREACGAAPTLRRAAASGGKKS